MGYDIVTFGSATRDVHVKCEGFRVVKEKKFVTGRGIAISLGSKIEINDLIFRTGGGGTNTAATFVKQGFRVAWCGMVGDDFGGQEVLKELMGLGVDISLARKTSKKHTNYSIVLHCPKEEERTILVYHGASSELKKTDIPWDKLRAKWFYLAPLSGKLALLFPILVKFARSHNIRVAANPGNAQLAMPRKSLDKILSEIDVLLLNQEESSLLLREKFYSEVGTLKKITRILGKNKIAVMTEGPLGAVASDGKYLYKAPILPTKVADRTGAGDSFGAAFVSEIARGGGIIQALQLGIANSAACISKLGAKEGLLKKGQRFKRVQVTRFKI